MHGVRLKLTYYLTYHYCFFGLVLANQAKQQTVLWWYSLLFYEDIFPLCLLSQIGGIEEQWKRDYFLCDLLDT